MAARTPPRTPGAQGGGQGAAPLGRSRSLCPCASFVFPEPEVMLKTSLECPFEPLNGMGGGGNFFLMLSPILRVRSQRLISTAAALGWHHMLSSLRSTPLHHVRSFQDRRSRTGENICKRHSGMKPGCSLGLGLVGKVSSGQNVPERILIFIMHLL